MLLLPTYYLLTTTYCEQAHWLIAHWVGSAIRKQPGVEIQMQVHACMYASVHAELYSKFYLLLMQSS